MDGLGRESQAGEESKKTSLTRIIIVLFFGAALLLFTYVFAIGPGFAELDNLLSNTDYLKEQGATLSLRAPESDYVVGERIPVEVVLTTKKDVSGIEVLLHYDDAKLEMSGPPETRDAFPQMPHVREAEPGVLAFSAITEPGEMFTGEGVVAVLSFRALGAGEASLSLEHTLGNTRDSNVAHNGGDILQSVHNITITIHDES